ncbi:DUF1657 domain-containing protein [Paenibacillus sp. S3N08]|uniref:DUF1657 domain-containing protein n=1 Tax=Paenibacillus agricola TaxID=2716264 RepID=A0ABX0JK85_9BACL|nr:DUF1657 domain-containing protein [Paenibacillus agricola]
MELLLNGQVYIGCLFVLDKIALSTQNQQQAKTMFTNVAQKTQNILDQVSPPLQQIANEEPQYKGFKKYETRVPSGESLFIYFKG